MWVSSRAERWAGVGIVILIVALVVIRTLLGPLPVYQRFEVVFVRLETGNSSLEIEEFPAIGDSAPVSLSSEELGRLRALGLAGKLVITGRSVHERGKRQARAVIVMQRQLTEPVSLRQPNGEDIIYFQTETGWRMYPEVAPTLERTIDLEAPDYNPRVTTYMVELSSGARQGGTAIDWSRSRPMKFNLDVQVR